MLTMPMAASCTRLSLTDVLHPKSKINQCQNHSGYQRWLLQKAVVVQLEGSIGVYELEGPSH